MKATIIEGTPESTYPKIMRSTHSGMIILFTEDRTGVVLAKGTTDRPNGHYRNDWCTDAFEAFVGTITLSND
jgi:hypothetical protein